MSDGPPVFAVGSRIAGYLLEEQIGRGGMAVVFRAHDERLDRTVALKILAPALADDEAFRQRFIRESRAAAAVDDPHIIPVFEAGEASGVLFIAMRYVRGGDVGSLVGRTGPLPTEDAAGIVSQVASALDAAHARGLVHRDVKPANMLLDAGGSSGRPDHVYLSDFGLSKGRLSAAKITATGTFLGTLDYMSPEQVDSPQVGPASDLYSLACTAFELLAGTPPFERDTAMAVLYAHAHEAPPPLTGRRPDLPDAVNEVFARALAKAPEDRYATCREFADALRGALGLRPYRSGPHERPVAVPPIQQETVQQEAAGRESQPTSPVPQPTATEVVTDGAGAAAPSRARWGPRTAIMAAVALAVVAAGSSALLLSGGAQQQGTVIFRSDFTGTADGWRVLSNPPDGHLGGGSYYIRDTTSNGGPTGVPTNASSVYPSAPPSIRIDVSARRVSGPPQVVQYGLVCHYISDNAYFFQIQGDKASIAKFSGGTYVTLASAGPGSANVDGANQLSATCASVAGQQAVRLTFSVNGAQFLAVTDRTNPLSGGTIGIFANYYHVSVPNGVEAAFQDFVVRTL